MATGKIKTLFSDKEKTEALFPRTKTSAVSNDDGVGLDALLADKASESFVADKIAEAQLNGGGGDIDLSGYATKDDVKNIDFPVDSVNGKTGAVTLSAANVGAVPTTRKVNGKALNGDISLNYADVGAVYAGNTSPATAGFYQYGFVMSRLGNTYGVSGGNDNYYLFLDGYNNVKAGLQLNGASTINWNKIFTAKTPPTAAEIGAASAHTILADGTDLNTVIYSGMYRLNANHPNMPNGCSWSQLLVIYGGGDTIAQIIFNYNLGIMWVRGASKLGADGSGNWTSWNCCHTKKILWQNANVSNAFNAQTISLNLSGYDGVEILYYVDSTTNIYQSTGFIKKGLQGAMYYVTAEVGNRVHRTFTVNANGVVFDTATASSGITASGLCKPYQIFGIKGVE